jgi:hypothetical protein
MGYSMVENRRESTDVAFLEPLSSLKQEMQICSFPCKYFWTTSSTSKTNRTGARKVQNLDNLILHAEAAQTINNKKLHTLLTMRIEYCLLATTLGSGSTAILI